MLMGIGGIVPLPSDALVSPVTFRVKRRNLRGILRKFDSKEDGQRELCGEWVVGLKTWQRMQAEWKATRKSNSKPSKSNLDASAPTEYLKRKERVILYIHGGKQFGICHDVCNVLLTCTYYSRCLLPVKCRSATNYFHTTS